jgi:hypothetical protein
MRLLSQKVLTALRHVSRARPISFIAALRALPLLCAPALLGSRVNPIVVDDQPNEAVTFVVQSDEATFTDAIHDAASSTFLANSLQDLSIDDPGTKSLKHMHTPSHNVPTPSREPTSAAEGSYMLVPITRFTTENSAASADVCLHNLRLVTKYHGFDLENANNRKNVGPTAESQDFLDNLDMGNDVDHRDAFAIALEREIAEAHGRINMRLRAAANASNIGKSQGQN